jgi:hypothetical protein
MTEGLARGKSSFGPCWEKLRTIARHNTCHHIRFGIKRIKDYFFGTK